MVTPHSVVTNGRHHLGQIGRGQRAQALQKSCVSVSGILPTGLIFTIFQHILALKLLNWLELSGMELRMLPDLCCTFLPSLRYRGVGVWLSIFSANVRRRLSPSQRRFPSPPHYCNAPFWVWSSLAAAAIWLALLYGKMNDEWSKELGSRLHKLLLTYMATGGCFITRGRWP